MTTLVGVRAADPYFVDQLLPPRKVASDPRPLGAPAQQTISSTPTLLERVWDTFVQAIKSVIEFLTPYFHCSTKADPSVQKEQRPLSAPQFLIQLWDGILKKEVPPQDGLVKGVGDPNPFARLYTTLDDQLGAQQTYSNQIPILMKLAQRQSYRMIAALLQKGDQIHAILINRRENPLRFYHYNPQTASVKTCNDTAEFVEHLRVKVPTESNHPFTLRAFTVGNP